jgi:hypothetical protein
LIDSPIEDMKFGVKSSAPERRWLHGSFQKRIRSQLVLLLT